MSDIEITPELLADIEAKAKKAIYLYPNRAVLAMIERIRQLEAAQCWVIVNKETKATFLGPFFTEAHANEKLGSMPFEYAKNYEVQPWKGGA